MTAAQQKLVEWADQLQEKTIFNSAINGFLWWLTKMLGELAKSTENLLATVYDTLDFTQYPAVRNFINSFRPFLWILLAIALIVLGWQLIFNREESKPKTVQNIIIFIICVFALPNFIITMNNLTHQTQDWLNTGSKPTNTASIVKSALTDFMYIDSQSWAKTQKKNNLPNSKILDIDIGEQISPETSKISRLGADITGQKMTVDSNGNYAFEDFKDTKILGFTVIHANYYLRYRVDYLVVLISLIAIIIAVFFCAFKVGRLIFEIVVHQLIAVLYAAADLTTGQRVKAVLKSLVSMYAVMFFSSVMIKLFYIYSDYISNRVTEPLPKALLLIIATFAVIDGPNIIEKTLGLDCGLSSSTQYISSLYHGSRLLSSIARPVSRAVGAGAKGLAGAGGFVTGLGKGFASSNDNSTTDTGIHTNSASTTDTGINTNADNSSRSHTLNDNSRNNANGQSINNVSGDQNGVSSINNNTGDLNNNGGTVNVGEMSNLRASDESSIAQQLSGLGGNETTSGIGDQTNRLAGDQTSLLSNQEINNGANQSVFDNRQNSVSGNINQSRDNNLSNYGNSYNSNSVAKSRTEKPLHPPRTVIGNAQRGYRAGEKGGQAIRNLFRRRGK